MAEGFLLVGHYLWCGDKHIAFNSSAIIDTRQRGTEPTKACCWPTFSTPSTHSLLISTVEIKLRVITKFLTSLCATLSKHKPQGCLRDQAYQALTRSRSVIRNDCTLIFCCKDEKGRRQTQNNVWCDNTEYSTGATGDALKWRSAAVLLLSALVTLFSNGEKYLTFLAT